MLLGVECGGSWRCAEAAAWAAAATRGDLSACWEGEAKGLHRGSCLRNCPEILAYFLIPWLGALRSLDTKAAS